MSTREKTFAFLILIFVGWFASYYYNAPTLLIISLIVSICGLTSIHFKSKILSIVNLDDKSKHTLSTVLRIMQIIGLVIVAGIAFAFWYVSIPCLVLWFLYVRENKLSQKLKKTVAISVVIFFVILQSTLLYVNRSPQLTLLDLPDNNEVQAESIVVKGNVLPKSSDLKINGVELEVDTGGNFTYEFKLREEQNTLNIEARNGKGKETQSLVIKRIFTEAEIIERKRLADEKEKKRQEAIAIQKQREQAELNAYYQTPAGRICKAHPEWTKEDCQNLADGLIWVGMEYDMLVYKRGQPNHINPSNYGYGTQYQYCWTRYNPSCFYDKNNDGLIDAYN